jgi:hypothetical protein
MMMMSYHQKNNDDVIERERGRGGDKEYIKRAMFGKKSSVLIFLLILKDL